MTQAPLMLGVITLIGYLALKKPIGEAIASSIKTSVGVLILQVGASTMVSSLKPILTSLTEKFGILGVIIDPYAAYSSVIEALGDSFGWVGYTVMIGFGVNILLVLFKRWTKIKTLFLQGNIMFLQAGLVTWIIYYYFKTGMWATVFLAGLLAGIYWAVFPNLIFKQTEEITGGAGFSIGHQQMFGCWLAAIIAPKIGNKSQSVEEIKLPGYLSIFQDTIVASSLIMLIFLGGIMLALGEETVTKMAGGKNWLVHIYLVALGFAVNITIILTGVKMFVAELTNSFKGISEKILPGAVIAVDCSAIYIFSPNAVIFGFIFGAIGQFLAVSFLILISAPILIIPGFIPLFFDNATIGVFANKFGGWKAAAIICFFSGVIQVLGGVWAASISGLSGGWQGSFDWETVWPGIMSLLKIMGIPAIPLIVIVMLIIPIIQDMREKEKVETT